MVSSKGSIDVNNVKIKQAIGWTRELIQKTRKDNISIKDEEYTAVMELLERFEKYAISFEIIRDNLSTKQWQKIWDEI